MPTKASLWFQRTLNKTPNQTPTSLTQKNTKPNPTPQPKNPKINTKTTHQHQKPTKPTKPQANRHLLQAEQHSSQRGPKGRADPRGRRGREELPALGLVGKPRAVQKKHPKNQAKRISTKNIA